MLIPKHYFVCFGAAAALSLAGAASAATFDFSYSLPTTDTTDFPTGFTSASGVFTAKDQGGGTYLVTGASGEWNGQAITGISPLDTEGRNDNLIMPSSDPKLSEYGVTFAVSGPIPGDGGAGVVNVYYFFGRPGGSGYTDYANTTKFSDTFNLTPVAVPEPGVWTLMLVGFAGLGASLRGRRAAKGFAA